MTGRYDAVLFDLLMALMDSWSLWNSIAGDPALGLRWRTAYLRLTYGAGAYSSYEGLVGDAGRQVGLPATAARRLIDRWDDLKPWSEVPLVLDTLRGSGIPLGIVTNCSEELGLRAAAQLSARFESIVTAERAGFYKPDPRPYLLALSEIGATPARTLFVAGSPADIPGASRTGMPVIWHNRAGLPPAQSSPAPIATCDTLHPLLEEIL